MDRLTKIPVCFVVQFSTISCSATVRLGLDHVKLLNKLVTWSCEFKVPAMNWPAPRGNVVEDTSRARIPGYRKRLKKKQTNFYFHSSSFSWKCWYTRKTKNKKKCNSSRCNSVSSCNFFDKSELPFLLVTHICYSNNI